MSEQAQRIAREAFTAELFRIRVGVAKELARRGLDPSAFEPTLKEWPNEGRGEYRIDNKAVLAFTYGLKNGKTVYKIFSVM